MPTPDTSFVISSSTALSMAEYLLTLLNTVMQNLPAAELRKMRDAMDHSVTLADELLCNISISSTFEMLTVNDASTILSTESSLSNVTSSYNPGRVTTRTPAKTPAPPSPPPSIASRNTFGNMSPPLTSRKKTRAPPSSPASVASRDTFGNRSPPLTSRNIIANGFPAVVGGETNSPRYSTVVSTRPRVGCPDYSLHPEFTRPGIPGPYIHPPLDPSKPDPPRYYVLTKALYVGIFCSSWSECSPWVSGVGRSTHCSTKHWTEARDIYNAAYAAGTCEVLS